MRNREPNAGEETEIDAKGYGKPEEVHLVAHNELEDFIQLEAALE